MKAKSLITCAALLATVGLLAVSCNREEHHHHEGAEKQKEHAQPDTAPHTHNAHQNSQTKPNSTQY